MIKIKQTVIVEGKYDKIKLENIISANIITTEGFRIYNNLEKQALIRNIAKKTGIIILTDSDSAGRRIRNFIKKFTKDSDCEIINIYMPEIPGKEKRKNTPSKENLIGVEGTDQKIISETFEQFGVTSEYYNDNNDRQNRRKISKIDFYEDGLSGGFESAKKREYLCEYLSLPKMSANALIEALNILMSFEDYKKALCTLHKKNEKNCAKL
jgi:ribonuclease M5